MAMGGVISASAIDLTHTVYFNTSSLVDDSGNSITAVSSNSTTSNVDDKVFNGITFHATAGGTTNTPKYYYYTSGGKYYLNILTNNDLGFTAPDGYYFSSIVFNYYTAYAYTTFSQVLTGWAYTKSDDNMTGTWRDTGTHPTDFKFRAPYLCKVNSITFTLVAIGGGGGGGTPEPTKYNVSIANSIVGGSVTASPTQATENSTITLTPTPNTGYELSSLSVTKEKGGSVLVSSNKFTMPADNVTVDATFRQKDYQISYSQSTGGTISGKASAKYNEEVTLTATPNSGYQFSSWTVRKNSGDTEPVINNKFTMPAEGVTVSATFTQTTPSGGGGGGEGGGESIDSPIELDFTTNPWKMTIGTNDNGKNVYPNITTGGKPDGCNIANKNRQGITFSGTNDCTLSDGYHINSSQYYPTLRHSESYFNDKPHLLVSKYNTFTVNAPNGYKFTSVVYHYATGGTTLYNGVYNNGGTEITPEWSPGGVYTLSEDGETGTYSSPSGVTSVTVTAASSRALWIHKIVFTLVATGEGGGGGDPDPEPTTYTVTVSPSITNGTVTATPVEAEEGDEITLTATPAAGYTFDEWDVKTETESVVTVTGNTFTMPAANVTVNATFTPTIQIPTISLGTPTWSVGDVVEFENVKDGVQITWNDADAVAITETGNKHVFVKMSLEGKKNEGSFENLLEYIYPLTTDANHTKPYVDVFKNAFGNGQTPEPQSVADSYRITIMEIFTAVEKDDGLDGKEYNSKTDYTVDEATKTKTFNVHKTYILLDIAGTYTDDKKVPGWKIGDNDVVATLTGATSNIQNSTYAEITFTCDKETASNYPYLSTNGNNLFIPRYASLTMDAPTGKCFKKIVFYFSVSSSADGSNHDWTYTPTGSHDYAPSSISDTWTVDNSYTTRLKMVGNNGASRITKILFYLDDLASVPHVVSISNSIENGTVSADINSAIVGAEVTLTATPATGYEFASWEVTNDESHEAISVTNNKFTMPDADVTVYATFSQITYTINKDNSIEGGTVDVVDADKTTAHYGEAVTLRNTPDTGWQLSGYIVEKSNHETVPVNDGTFEMPAEDVTISGYFTKVQYGINVTKSGEGNVTLKKNGVNITPYANYGDNITVVADPLSYYTFTSIEVKDADENIVPVEGNTFTMPASAVTVNVVFTENAPGNRTYTLTFSEEQMEGITPENFGSPSDSGSNVNNLNVRGVRFETGRGTNTYYPTICKAANVGDTPNIYAKAGNVMTLHAPEGYAFSSVRMTFINNYNNVGNSNDWQNTGGSYSTNTWTAAQDDVEELTIPIKDITIFTSFTFNLIPLATPEVGVSAALYSTYYNSHHAVLLPTGVEAYVSYYDDDAKKMKFEKQYSAGDVVPAGVAVVIGAQQAGYTLEFSDQAGVMPEKNDLMGTDVPTTLENDPDYYYYALSLNSNRDLSSVGFYWMEEDGAAFRNGAHKAYLKLEKNKPTVQQTRTRFVFKDFFDEGTATGVMQIPAAAVDHKVAYNLNGQRISTSHAGKAGMGHKGIIIVNGKKMLNR